MRKQMAQCQSVGNKSNLAKAPCAFDCPYNPKSQGEYVVVFHANCGNCLEQGHVVVITKGRT